MIPPTEGPLQTKEFVVGELLRSRPPLEEGRVKLAGIYPTMGTDIWQRTEIEDIACPNQLVK